MIEEALVSTVIDCLAQGEAAELCLIMDSHGSVPRGAGAAMAIFANGRTAGTVGGGALEHEAKQMALQLLAGGQSARHFFSLAPNAAADLGMVCGGNVELLFLYCAPDDATLRFFSAVLAAKEQTEPCWLVFKAEFGATGFWAGLLANGSGRILAQYGSSFSPSDTLYKSHPAYLAGPPVFFSLPLNNTGQVYVFGGGHVAQQLVPLLHRVFFRCTVIDDREEFASPALFPDADQLLAMPFEEALANTTVSREDYIVILTRGHLYDSHVLAYALGTPARYIGMIGSANKIDTTYNKLIAEQGFHYRDFSRVHAPIGLPIGGATPQEIAVSIAAEMIMVRNKAAKISWQE